MEQKIFSTTKQYVRYFSIYINERRKRQTIWWAKETREAIYCVRFKPLFRNLQGEILYLKLS